ncbi:MAG: hypothetical protein KC656_21300, partial [Myxococcales bacterium]|nr:hypothetical protein [Myxococcales bacterium]
MLFAVLAPALAFECKDRDPIICQAVLDVADDLKALTGTPVIATGTSTSRLAPEKLYLDFLEAAQAAKDNGCRTSFGTDGVAAGTYAKGIGAGTIESAAPHPKVYFTSRVTGPPAPLGATWLPLD